MFLIITVLAGIFTVSSASASAASKPATPTVTIANGGSSQGLYVSWNRVATGAVYQIAYRPNGNWRSGQGYTYKTTADTHITLTGLTSGVCYQVQVRARVNGVYGGYSKTKSMTFLSRPLIRDSLEDDLLAISWNKIKGANCYQLVRWNESTRRWDTIYKGSTVGYLDRSAKAGKSYRYQLRAMYKTAKNGTAYSAWSNVDYATYYPQIKVKAIGKVQLLPGYIDLTFQKKRFLYEVSWSVRNPSETQRYEVRLRNNLNSDAISKTVAVKGNKIMFQSDDAYNYVSVRYINDLGRPVTNGTWVTITPN